MTADELHALAVRTRDAARLAERHGTSAFGYRRAAREACERMGEMSEQLAEAEERAQEYSLDALAMAEPCRSCADLDEQLAEVTRERDDERARANEWLTQLHDAKRERDEAHLAIDQALGGGMEDLERQLAKAEATIADMCREREHLTRQLGALKAERDSWRNMVVETRDDEDAVCALHDARAELRDLVAALGQDDGPRAKAIQHARAVLEEWGMR